MLDKVASNPSQKNWQLSQVPTRRFYSELHSYLKRDRKLGKCEIGAIYVSIDPQLNSYRADNANRVIENMLRTHKKNQDSPMTYYKASPLKMPSCNENKVPQTPHVSNPHYLKKNVDRRDKRKDKQLHEVQNKLHTANRTIENLQVEVSESTADYIYFRRHTTATGGRTKSIFSPPE